MNNYALNLGLAYRMIDDIAEDYGRGSEDLDGDIEFVPTSRSSYTGLLGFDKARKMVERMIDESERMIKPFEHNDVLVEFIQMIQERLP
jgi:geranylgeranyl pyrophosphate synthase